MIKVTDRNDFTEKVLNGEGYLVVRFCADWSGPCQIMSPIYEEMSSIYSNNASFFKIDIDEMPELKDEYGVVELPTILVFKKGVVVDFIIGLISRSSLITKIESVLINKSR